MHRNCLFKLYHKFLVSLPVIVICSLIVLVYFSYICTYLFILIATPPNLEPSKFFFISTSYPTSANRKGLILVYTSTFLFTMLMLSIFRTIFSDPGYFPSPMELEYKIMSHKNGQKGNPQMGVLAKKIEESAENGPLTASEYVEIRMQLAQNSILQPDEPIRQMIQSNDEIFDQNKKNYSPPVDEKNCPCPTTTDDVFLNICSGIDIAQFAMCTTCLRMKIERSHHCRHCGKCVLKMDHHCPWLANCIGFGNYKSFLLIQFYGVALAILVAGTYWEAIVNYNMNYNSNIVDCWLVVTAYTINCALFGFLLWLFYVNFRNMLLGQTVIENSDRKRFPSSKTLNIYDMGYYRNFTNVFGGNPCVWLVPFWHNKAGGGCVFETTGFRLK